MSMCEIPSTGSSSSSSIFAGIFEGEDEEDGAFWSFYATLIGTIPIDGSGYFGGG